MPAIIPKHVAIRKEFLETTKVAFALNECLESVIAVKTKGSSEVFHGKVDHSQPPWNAAAANLILELHAWVRRTETLYRRAAGLPARLRGGSGDNTRRGLEALTRLCERLDDGIVREDDRWLSSWCKRARVSLGAAESVKRVPRNVGEREAQCPWCKRDTLRQVALAGTIFCIDPKCFDDDGKRPKANLEMFQGDWVLRWQDGIIGAP